jgi:hypothetical protein
MEIYTERFFYRTKTSTNESFSNEAISVFFLVLRFWHNFLISRQNLDWGVCAVQKMQFLQLTRLSLLDWDFAKKKKQKNLAATFRSQQKTYDIIPFSLFLLSSKSHSQLDALFI